MKHTLKNVFLILRKLFFASIKEQKQICFTLLPFLFTVLKINNNTYKYNFRHCVKPKIYMGIKKHYNTIKNILVYANKYSLTNIGTPFGQKLHIVNKILSFNFTINSSLISDFNKIITNKNTFIIG